VSVQDFEKVDIVKNNPKDSRNIHIVIPPKDLSTNTEHDIGSTSLNALGLSSFIHLHIVVES
jgi:hypothetical protein